MITCLLQMPGVSSRYQHMTLSRDDYGPEYLPNINYQVVEQKGRKDLSVEILNGNLPNTNYQVVEQKETKDFSVEILNGNLPNTNYQVVEQKGTKDFSVEILNDNLPKPDATLPPLESQRQPTQVQETQPDNAAGRVV
ncbi:hypothetical protein DSO57_1036062 [Entomophthora muscae]|uniref:Uncharacterized protein n=1 Tax=Entomophthora muscae TaxID=34485 RepID=A0ACC2TA31_9FUNG|nr:hypothetical protein DSO57_1036062 [Entomophthora muscae]